MTKHTASKQRFQMPAPLVAAQPWVRDHYTTLRTEAGPRWEHAKTVVVPVFNSTTTKIREDYLPAAAEASSRLANEATRRSAPYRAEIASRGMTTMAAVRGQVTAEDVAALHHGKGRTVKVISAAAIVGAATSAGVLLWQRTHNKPWDADSDEIVEPPMGELKKESMAGMTPARESADRAKAQAKPGVGTPDDDPADPDGGGTSAGNSAANSNSNSNGSATHHHAKGKAGM